MKAGGQKYILDTQLFIQAFHDPGANEALSRFHDVFAPFEFLSAVVAQELRSGARAPRDRKALERHLLGVFERTDRVITPSVRAWHRSGDVLAEMARKEGLDVSGVSKAFGNDVLLALSCRESGSVLVSDNARDFARIQRYVAFQFVRPWPTSLRAPR